MLGLLAVHAVDLGRLVDLPWILGLVRSLRDISVVDAEDPTGTKRGIRPTVDASLGRRIGEPDGNWKLSQGKAGRMAALSGCRPYPPEINQTV